MPFQAAHHFLWTEFLADIFLLTPRLIGYLSSLVGFMLPGVRKLLHLSWTVSSPSNITDTVNGRFWMDIAQDSWKSQLENSRLSLDSRSGTIHSRSAGAVHKVFILVGKDTGSTS